MSTQDEFINELATALPYYPFKGIERFYDISGILRRPSLFRKVIQSMTEHYRSYALDWIAGIDARGFVFGPPVALALGIPFFMLRKEGKLPNSVSGSQYTKEYRSVQGDDVLCIPKGLLRSGDKVLLVDDLVATGGTLCAAIELIQELGGVVVECACIVEVKAMKASDRLKAKGFNDIPIHSMISDDHLVL